MLALDRLILQNFFNQIIYNVMMAARERAQKMFNVATALHRERRELQARNPSFGARFELFDLFGGEM